MIQAKGISDGGSASADPAARAHGTGTASGSADVATHSCGSSEGASSVTAASAPMRGTWSAQASTSMPALTLKFFELQRRSRAPSQQRFSQEFSVHDALLDDQFAYREIGFWSPLRSTTGHMAMVTFPHKFIRWTPPADSALASPTFQNPPTTVLGKSFGIISNSTNVRGVRFMIRQIPKFVFFRVHVCYLF